MHSKHGYFNVGLKLVKGDQRINEICKAVMIRGKCTDNCDIHLCFEHPIWDVQDAESVDPLHENIVSNVVQKEAVVESLLSSNDYDSAEDSPYRPNPLSNIDEDNEQPKKKKKSGSKIKKEKTKGK